MDSDAILPLGFIVVVLILIVGLGTLIARDQNNAQQRAIACIEAGRQFVGGDCVAGPTP